MLSGGSVLCQPVAWLGMSFLILMVCGSVFALGNRACLCASACFSDLMIISDCQMHGTTKENDS